MVKCKHCGGEILAKCSADITLGINEWGTPNDFDVRSVDKSWTSFYICDECGEMADNLEDLKEV